MCKKLFQNFLDFVPGLKVQRHKYQFIIIGLFYYFVRMKLRLIILLILLVVGCAKAFSQQRFDIVIDEIMADPSPQVGLPNIEYIELKNVSGQDVNLQGWKLTTLTATSGSFGNYTLPADSFLIITSTSGAASFTGFGRVLGIPGFPALTNDGTTLRLISKEGKTIHFVSYNLSWYQNAVKEEGGWSLEMIDPHNPCSATNNWKASIDNAGGTPGKKNSVDGLNKDNEGPVVRNVWAKDGSTIVLQFDEAIDSTDAVNASRYSITPSLLINSIAVASNDFTVVELALNTSLSSGIIYNVTISGIKDCSGNARSSQEIKLGLPQDAVALDVVVNEILFNPGPDAYDYVEFYNRSNKIIDASKLYVGNRNSAGTISSLKKLSEQPFYIFPDSYVVITENLSSLQKNYLVKNTDAVLVVSSLASFPDDKGTVVLANFQGEVVDELSYSDDWHFDLIANAEGVSLERIDPDKPTQNEDNWHSAASTAGYGTPTYKNSQYKQTNNISETVEITPKVFSPDNDGIDDIATIQYQITETGYVANISILPRKILTSD